MRRFKSVSGDIYVGNVLSQVCNNILMDNYSVWYEGESQPFDNRHPDDSVHFIMEVELPL